MELEEWFKRARDSSLLNWFPKVKDLGIPIPKTKWLMLPEGMNRSTVEEGDERFGKFIEDLDKVAEELGYPVFVRTDQSSAKHSWKSSAIARFKKQLAERVLNTMEDNELKSILGLPYKAMVLREVLELDWRFKAFHGEMPVAKERRYFIKDGQVRCHHPYWFKAAIEKAHEREGIKGGFLGSTLPHSLPNKWQDMLRRLNRETPQEIDLLSGRCSTIGRLFKDYWSVDFACTRDGEWYLIDMADGYVSEHYPGCSEEMKSTEEGG